MSCHEAVSRRLNEFSFRLVNIFASQERSFPALTSSGECAYFSHSPKSTRSAYDDAVYLPLKSHVPLLFVGFRSAETKESTCRADEMFSYRLMSTFEIYSVFTQSGYTFRRIASPDFVASHWPEKWEFARTNNSIMLINQTLSIHFLFAAYLRLWRAGCDPRGSWNLISPGNGCWTSAFSAFSHWPWLPFIYSQKM